MRILIRPIAHRPARIPGNPARLHPSDRDYRSLSSAQGILGPVEAVRTVRPIFHGKHIEAHGKPAPRCLPLQKVSGGANNLALLAPRYRVKRAAELLAAALPNFDHRQHIPVETNQIEFAGFAAKIAPQNFDTATLQVVRRELFGLAAALPALILHTP